jgi:hypothetical protein
MYTPGPREVTGGDPAFQPVEHLVSTGHVLLKPRGVLGGVLHQDSG